MKNRVSPLFFLMGTLFFPLSGELYASAAAADYTWAACVSTAARENAELRAAQANYDAVSALELGAMSGYLPTLSGTLSATRSNSTTVLPGVGGGNLSQTRESYSATLSASQNLFAGLQDAGKTRQAKANTEAAQAALQITKAKVSYELKANYEGLLYAQESVRLTAEILKRREDNLRLVELRFESGRENKGSVLLSRAYRNQARYENTVAQNAVESARALLARSLGLDSEAPISLSEPVPVTDPPAATLAWEKIAGETPDHRQAAAQENAADAAITVARSGFFPSLNLSGSAGRVDDHFFPDDERWSIGLNLTFPLFSGLKDLSSLRNAIASSVASTATRVNLDRNLIAKLKQARNAFAEAFEKLQVDESFRDAAQLRAEIARNKYNNGLLTFDDWDVIESDLINRQKSYLQSKRDRAVSEAAWEQAQGKGVFP